MGNVAGVQDFNLCYYQMDGCRRHQPYSLLLTEMRNKDPIIARIARSKPSRAHGQNVFFSRPSQSGGEQSTEASASGLRRVDAKHEKGHKYRELYLPRSSSTVINFCRTPDGRNVSQGVAGKTRRNNHPKDIGHYIPPFRKSEGQHSEAGYAANKEVQFNDGVFEFQHRITGEAIHQGSETWIDKALQTSRQESERMLQIFAQYCGNGNLAS